MFFSSLCVCVSRGYSCDHYPRCIGYIIQRLSWPMVVTRSGQDWRLVAGSLEAAYSLNWGAREIWGKGGGETLALL